MSNSESNTAGNPEPLVYPETLTDGEAAIVDRQLTAGRAEWPADETVSRVHGESAARCIEDFFYDAFVRYFQNAESKRRWDIDRDIPWELASPDTSDTTATIVESFAAVEMFLPDYTHKIMELVRESRGRALFQANWGYEESKHSLVLGRWLIASGKRTQDELEDFERSLLGAEWRLPFDTPRQMILYTMVQELATGINYTNLRKRAEEEGDTCLSRTLRWVSADESAHYNFFRRGVKAYLDVEADETIADLRFVFENFSMPAHALIPGWEERSATIEAAGVYGPRIYLSKIYRPVLEDLGLTRQQLKDAGLPESVADTMGDTADQSAVDVAQKPYQRTRSLPAIPIPASSTRRTVATV